MAILELSGVSKRYEALTVTDDVSLALQQGEALGIIGPNGAGKSTLFNLIGGTHRVDAGQVRFMGRDVTQMGLLPKANLPAGALTLLERKRLELARALATDPRLLLLDEIAGGLTEGECRALVETIRQIRDSGVSIIWIEHIVHALTAVVGRLIVIEQDIAQALRVADRVYCFQEGRVSLSGRPADLSRDAIANAYFGTEDA